MNIRKLWTMLAAAALAACPAPAESLYNPVSDYSNLYMTSRPKSVGDIITIVIEERSNAEERSDTDINKESNINASLNGIDALNPFGEPYPINPLFRMQSKNEYEAEGQTRQSNRVSARIAAKVVRVLDNGNLLLEGRRQIYVGKDKRSILITGVVRPQDVKPDNSVLSTHVADAEIRYEGTGPVNNPNKPTLLHRLLDLLPFF